MSFSPQISGLLLLYMSQNSLNFPKASFFAISYCCDHYLCDTHITGSHNRVGLVCEISPKSPSCLLVNRRLELREQL